MSQCEPNKDKCELTLETIYAQHDEFIRSVIRFAAKGSEDCDDVYQEVFIVLSRKEDFSEIQDIRGYLYRLIVNKVKELLRKRISADTRLKRYSEWRVPKEQVSVDRDLAVDDEVNKTVDLIKQYLSEKESQAVLLRYQQEYDNEQGAHIMNVRKETYVRYISVGLSKIRKIIRSRKGPEE